MKRLATFSFLVLACLWAPLAWVLSEGFRPESIRLLLERTDIAAAALRSISLGLCSAFVSTLIGTLTAFALPRLTSAWKSILGAGLIFPMLMPEISMAISFLIWFICLGWPLGWGTLLASHVAFSVSYSAFTMKTRVSTLDKSLLDAAMDLGAGRWGVFRHALLPQLMPGLVASMVLCFMLSFDDFLISFFVKGVDQVTLPIQIYSMIRIRIGPEIYALSAILFCVSFLLVLMTQLWITKRSQATPFSF